MKNQISLLVFSMVFSLATQVAAAGPEATVSGAVQDVGEVSRGETIVTEFVIRNSGDEVLRIKEVKPSCGCTVASYDDAIDPGAEGKVRAEIETGAFKGPISKAIAVFTNDPANPRLSLVVKAVVKAGVEARPGYARFLAVQGVRAEKETIQVWSNEIANFKVTGTESPHPFIHVEHRRRAKDEGEADEEGESQRKWEVAIELAADAPPGPFSGYVVIFTNSPSQGRLRIPVSGLVQPALEVSPREMNLGRIEIKEPFVGYLELRNLGRRGVEVEEVTIDIEGAVVEVEEVTPGKIFRIALTLPPDLPKGALSGTLSLRTSSGQWPLLEVRVAAFLL